MKHLRIEQKAFMRSMGHAFNGLSAFTTLPCDIMFEVFQYLHPIDLYHILCTSKFLRGILQQIESRWAWRASFTHYSEVPWCPPDASYHEWAALLFGPDICDVRLLLISVYLSDITKNRYAAHSMQWLTLRFVPGIANHAW